MTAAPGFSIAPVGGGSVDTLKEAANRNWVRQIVDVVNNTLRGKMNVVLKITLRAGFATTVITDSRIGPFSALLLQPLTAHAAGALYSATSVLADLTTQRDGAVTLNHVNDANADKTFNLVIIG